MMNSQEFKYMKEAIAADLAELLSNDFKLTITESLDKLYNSETYAKLSDPNTGLYFQSSKYVYTFLRNELNSGNIS